MSNRRHYDRDNAFPLTNGAQIRRGTPTWKLWRLTRFEHQALDGKGAVQFGSRYSSPGLPLVSFASEAGLAVLVALRYYSARQPASDDDYVLGWTEANATPDRVPDDVCDMKRKDTVDQWAQTGRSLLIAVRSRGLPEADVILLNAAHPDAAAIAPLTWRAFRFAECLHQPPMLKHYDEARG